MVHDLNVQSNNYVLLRSFLFGFAPQNHPFLSYHPCMHINCFIIFLSELFFFPTILWLLPTLPIKLQHHYTTPRTSLIHIHHISNPSTTLDETTKYQLNPNQLVALPSQFNSNLAKTTITTPNNNFHKPSSYRNALCKDLINNFGEYPTQITPSTESATEENTKIALFGNSLSISLPITICQSLSQKWSHSLIINISGIYLHQEKLKHKLYKL